jgi:hypothetical protein
MTARDEGNRLSMKELIACLRSLAQKNLTKEGLRLYLVVAVFCATPFLCLWLLAVGLFPLFWDDPHSTMLYLLYTLLAIVVIVPTVNVIAMIVSNYKATKGENGGRSSLDFAIHVVPYGILSLSMLFEHDRILGGKAEGMAAIASIIILFLLSELGLVIYESVRRAEAVSSEFGNALDTANKRLQILPWLEPYLKLSVSAEEDAQLVKNLGELMNQYAAVSKNASAETRSLARFFLRDYVWEELQDVRAELEEPDIPREVIPPLGKGGYSYFATNVGFYSKFVNTAINQLNMRRGARQDPCLAVITNALPAQFWLWMSDASTGVYYKPVADYLEAQFEGAKNSLRVFRTVLVGPDGPEAPSGELQRSVIPALLSKSEWDRQKPWSLIQKSASKLLTVGESRLPVPVSYLVPQLAWTPRDTLEEDPRKKMTSWVIKEVPKDVGTSYTYPALWSFYCRKLHYVNGAKPSGATEIFLVDPSNFAEAPPRGFNGCPDLMFLGRCPRNTPDVWREEGDQPQWDLALMTSMSSQTQTMFLTLIYDEDKIKRLWEGFRLARKNLGAPIASSNQLKEEMKGPALAT